MPLLSNIVGFSLFGLATRFGQLGIQRRNLFDSMFFYLSLSIDALPMPSFDSILRPDPGGHLIAMGVFGYAGYWAYKWDLRAAELLAQKRAEIRERRGQAAAVADE